MAVFFNVNGNGFKGGRIGALKSEGVLGFYHDGALWVPNIEEVRPMLPARWRKAWDNFSPLWWNDETREPLMAVTHVTGAKGQALTSVYFHPNLDD